MHLLGFSDHGGARAVQVELVRLVVAAALAATLAALALATLALAASWQLLQHRQVVRPATHLHHVILGIGGRLDASGRIRRRQILALWRGAGVLWAEHGTGPHAQGG